MYCNVRTATIYESNGSVSVLAVNDDTGVIEEIYMNKKFISSIASWGFLSMATIIAGVRTAITYDLDGPFLVIFVIMSLFIFFTLIALLIKIFKNRGV